MPAEDQKTNDSFSAVVTHPVGTPTQTSDTATGLVVLLILGYLLLKFLRK